jgi:long-chain acyl-CoA synthetase
MWPGRHALERPSHPAIIMGGSGSFLSYRELNDRSNRVARLFWDAGLRFGDHVAVLMENRPEFFEVCWGAQRSGLFYTCINWHFNADEAAYIIDDCDAQVLVVSEMFGAVASELLDKMPNVKVRLVVGEHGLDGYDSYVAARDRFPAEPLAEELEGSRMLYSSGTTGRPKGVKYKIARQRVGEQPAEMGMMTTVWRMGPDTVYLSPAPLYHSAPLFYCMSTLRLGGTAVVMEQFDPEDALALIEKYRVTHSQWVPTMFVRMLKLPDDVRARYDLTSLEVAIHAAAPCPVEVKRRMIEWWGPVLHEYYAGTEGNGFVYCNSEMWLSHPGTVGLPIACTIHIVGDDGEELPTGESGTIYFEGGNSFEYHNDPEKTASSRRGNGWSTLGDVGYLDEGGYLYLTDRKAYMIISGGVNIYPQEAENVLISHPDVIDVAVFGVPNDEFGEEVKAVVQPVVIPVDDEASDALARDLIAFCRSQLADVKCPRSIDFREELPRHPTGKLYKRLLKDEYWAGHQSRII